MARRRLRQCPRQNDYGTARAAGLTLGAGMTTLVRIMRSVAAVMLLTVAAGPASATDPPADTPAQQGVAAVEPARRDAAEVERHAGEPAAERHAGRAAVERTVRGADEPGAGDERARDDNEHADEHAGDGYERAAVRHGAGRGQRRHAD